jgi:hypothetical protein
MKKTVSFLTALLLASSLSPMLVGAAPLERATKLSAVGERSIQDLRRCLTSNDTLDVFYLIDNSGSLADTDPTVLRADIMGESLRQLASLSQAPTELKVNWNLGFFSTNYESVTSGWMEIDPKDVDAWPDALASFVRGIQPSGATDWLRGITGAQTELAKQKRKSDGCQVLIWLTDGGLNVNDDDGASAAAMNSLCGQVAVEGARQPSLGKGPLYELRQSGVVVFGVLLDVGQLDTYQERKSWLLPLVEGSGQLSVDGKSKTLNCGDGSGVIPETHSAGAYLRAQSPEDLAVQFLRLAGEIRGGSSGTINPDGTFDINPGVASVTIISLESADLLKLQDPSGSNAIGSDGVTITETAGASALSIEVNSTEDFGTWRVTGTDPQDTVLIAYGALGLEPSSDNALVSGSESEIRVSAKLSNESLFKLADYQFEFFVYLISPDGSATRLASGTAADFLSGDLIVPITPEANRTKIQLRYEVVNLRTTVGSTQLAPIGADQFLVVSLPDNFPTFGPIPLQLSVLSGRSSSAVGYLEVSAPVSGDDGYFCMPSASNTKIVSDSADREDTWVWSFNTELSPKDDGCYLISAGQVVRIEVRAANSITANSEVRAESSIVLRDAAGAELEMSIPIEFSSERLINPFIYGLLTALLTLLSALLPLLVLYAINRATTKVEHGNELLKASFPVTYDVKGETTKSTVGLDLKGREIGLNHFLFQAPKSDSPEVSISESVTAVARVSLNPFLTPWFELQAKDGYRVFTKSPARSGARYKAGKSAEFNGQLSKLSALIIRDSDLVKSGDALDEIPASLLVFDRNSGGTNPDFQARMVGVINDLKLKNQISEARKSIEASEAQKAKKFKSKDSKPTEVRKETKPRPPTAPGKPTLTGGPKVPPPVAPKTGFTPPTTPGSGPATKGPSGPQPPKL